MGQMKKSHLAIVAGSTAIVGLCVASPVLASGGTGGSGPGGVYTYEVGVNGATATSVSVVRAASAATMGMVNTRIASFNRGTGSGRNATQAYSYRSRSQQTSALSWKLGEVGDGAAPAFLKNVGVWADFNWTGYKDAAGTAFEHEGNAYVGTVGADYSFANDRILAGLAVSMERSLTDTVGDENGHVNRWGVSFTPYVSVAANKYLSVEALAGYTTGWGEYKRTFGGGGGVLPYTEATSDLSTDRWYMGGGLNGNYAYRGWDFGGSLKMNYTRDHVSSFRDSEGQQHDHVKTEIGTVSPEVSVGYVIPIGNSTDAFVEPYLKYRYDYDFIYDKNTDVENALERNVDPSAHVLTGGLTIFGNQNITGGIEASTMMDRGDASSTSASATLRVDF